MQVNALAHAHAHLDVWRKSRADRNVLTHNEIVLFLRSLAYSFLLARDSPEARSIRPKPSYRVSSIILRKFPKNTTQSLK